MTTHKSSQYRSWYPILQEIARADKSLTQLILLGYSRHIWETRDGESHPGRTDQGGDHDEQSGVGFVQ